MNNKRSLNEVLTLTRFNDKKLKVCDPALNNFAVIEDLYITQEAYLKSETCPEAMSIFIVTNGSGKINLNLEEVDIQENSLVQLITGNINEVFIESQSLLISGVSFTRDFIEEMGIMTEFLPNIFSFFSSGSFLAWNLKPEDTNTIKHQIRLLAGYVNNFTTHPYGKEILVHTFYVFLFEIEALRMKYSDSTYFPFSRQEIHVHKFMKLVQQQFRKVRAIKDYASQLNVSAKHLTEIVKQFTGKNASEMITEQVIKEAKILLKDPQLSIGEIAYKLYFSDQSFFGKYFKRQTGISPKTYRESVFINQPTDRNLLYEAKRFSYGG